MSLFKRFKDLLPADAKKFLNKDFLEAMTAGSAMVAAADGSIDPEEKAKMMNFIKSNDELRVYSQTDVVDSFDKWVRAIQFDVDSARAEMLRAIGKLKGKDEPSRLLVRMVCAIGASDGDFDDAEKKVAAEIARELDLSADEFID